LEAGLICATGGAGKPNSKVHYTPTPLTGCPPVKDPLAARQFPTASSCDYTKKVVDGLTVTLSPGVYCGLKLTNAAQVTLSPGTYVIKDDKFEVDQNAVLQGTGVTIALQGKGSTLKFEAASTISLTAPKDGPLAGLLIFDDPTGASALLSPPPPALPLDSLGLSPVPPPREHEIKSDNARTLLGTIYMPQGRLVVDANKPIADKSAYTVIVVRALHLYDGPRLILNSDYSASDVPVPNGVGPYGGTVALTN
jgi:hypothetical protein